MRRRTAKSLSYLIPAPIKKFQVSTGSEEDEVLPFSFLGPHKDSRATWSSDSKLNLMEAEQAPWSPKRSRMKSLPLAQASSSPGLGTRVKSCWA